MLLSGTSKAQLASDTLVRIPKTIAIMILQDLTRYDGLKYTDSLLKETNKDLREQNRALISQISLLEQMRANDTVKIGNLTTLRLSSENQYKNQVKQNRFLKLGLLGLTALLGYTIFK